LSLASFRETSELEYGADSAFIVAPTDDSESEGEAPSRVTLKYLKNRHGEAKDVTLTFDRKRQRFSPAEPEPAGPAPRADSGKLQSALRVLWDKARPANDDGGPDDQ
jgi:replicative DNA helicase